MMTLHHDKDIFKDVLEMVSSNTGIALNMLEKDYYVTMVLRELVKRDHNFIFKGGTSLSKCFHCISRFSEDIDLCYENYDKLSIGKKRKIKSTIVQVCEDLGLEILNLDKIRSRRVFNRYDIEYPKMFPNSTILKQVVLVETAFQTEAFPWEIRKAQSLIGEYFEKIGREDVIRKFDLYSFDVKVQSMNRTFVDKLFALVDYVLTDRCEEHSRHLYDIYCLYGHISFDYEFKELFLEVKKIRSQLSYCPSAQDDVNILDELDKIIRNDIYKEDYKRKTEPMTYDHVTYRQTIDVLQQVLHQLQILEIE